MEEGNGRSTPPRHFVPLTFAPRGIVEGDIIRAHSSSSQPYVTCVCFSLSFASQLSIPLALTITMKMSLGVSIISCRRTMCGCRQSLRMLISRFTLSSMSRAWILPLLRILTATLCPVNMCSPTTEKAQDRAAFDGTESTRVMSGLASLAKSGKPNQNGLHVGTRITGTHTA